jgi:hypothetical protein
MIESEAFVGLPAPLRREVDQELVRFLDEPGIPAGAGGLPAEERKAIRTILRETMDSPPPFASP